MATCVGTGDGRLRAEVCQWAQARHGQGKTRSSACAATGGDHWSIANAERKPSAACLLMLSLRQRW